MQMAQGKFGSGVALELALRTDGHQRSAERWLAGKSMTADNLAALLCSDIGPDVIASLMGDDPKAWPAWYAGYRRQVSLSKLRRTLSDQQRALEALEREAVS